jgi:putative phosphonate catabolism associated alcohol dehydrogenase
MSTSLAAVFSGDAGQLELRQFPTPLPAAGEIVVRVLGCTLCGSDLHTIEGRRNVPVPTVLGHEIVGQIVSFGESAPQQDLAGQALRLGDRVTWSLLASCGQCFFCERDLPQKCLHAVKYGHEAFQPGRDLLGGLAEHCLLVPGTAIVRLPEELPLEVACPVSCATATIAAALEAAGDTRGRTACVLGAGLLGLTACAMARSRGAAEVICVEVHPTRRVLSTQFGATRAIAPDSLTEAVARATNNRGVDVVLELSGSPAAFDAAWPIVRTGGTIVLVGSVFPSPPVSLLLEQVVRRHLTLRGIHNYAPRHLAAAVKFLADSHQQYPFATLVAQWHPLHDIQRALAAAREPCNIRVGVQMS